MGRVGPQESGDTTGLPSKMAKTRYGNRQMTRKRSLPSAAAIKKIVEKRERIDINTFCPIVGCEFEFRQFPQQKVTITIFKNKEESIFEVRPSHTAVPENGKLIDSCSTATSSDHPILAFDECLGKLLSRIGEGSSLVVNDFDSENSWVDDVRKSINISDSAAVKTAMENIVQMNQLYEQGELTQDDFANKVQCVAKLIVLTA